MPDTFEIPKLSPPSSETGDLSESVRSAALRGLRQAATLRRPWITFDPLEPEPDRFAFSFDFGAASPIAVRETEDLSLDADDVEYYSRIESWSHQAPQASSASALAQRPKLYAWNRPRLYPKQEQALFDPARWVFIEASTKAGKTAGCMVWLLEQALRGRPGANFWWVAPTYRQSRMVFRRFERAIPRQAYIANRSELTITLPNGATIWHLSADRPDNVYGEDVGAAVLDEASRVSEDIFIAVRSTLTATKGPARLIGNVKGRKNFFYRESRKAEAKEPGRAYFRLTWRDAVQGGVLDEEEIEDARRSLPEAAFKELYEAEPASDEGNPFGIDKIEAITVPSLSDGEPVIWGWDLAKSVDYTVGIALDEQGRVCRFVRYQRDWTFTMADIRQHVGTSVPALVDATGVGDPVVEQIQEGRGNVEGFKFSPSSKQELMVELSTWISRGAGEVPRGVITNELESFEYQYTATGVRYSAPPGAYDDCVMALALAVRGWRGYGSAPTSVYGEVYGGGNRR
ncbi:MAG: terminase family protein [Acidobacteriota bacterium]